jgi:sugar O-acyltransferase (sialic acid O-acetyltransferase NeuD family)
MPNKLLIFPFGGNAKESLMSILAVNETRREWEVVGFVDDDHTMHGKDYCGIRVLGGREQFKEHSDALVLAVPGSPSNYLRRKALIQSLGIENSRFATVCHPSVVKAPDAVIGHNTLLMPHVVVSSGAHVGDHCIILPNTVIAHDSAIGDFSCVGSNVSISGSVSVGSECYIGSGTAVRDQVRIGNRTLIGLGSNVVADVDEGVVAAGNPARVMVQKIC